MTDSIQVLKPGVRFTDAEGVPLSGAVLSLYETDGVTPKIVYSDFARTAAVGTTVTADAGGYPTSDGSTKIELYVGPGLYDATLKTSAGVTVWAHTDIQGAIDTSLFLTSSAITPSFPVVNTSSNQALGLTSKSKKYNTDCSGGDITHTLALAATLGDSWSATVRHDGTANQVKIVGTSSQLLKIGGRAGVIGFALTRKGQTVLITCDATGFIVEETSPGLFDTTGVIVIADRLATPPASPEAGARYIVTAGPTGAWSAYGVGSIAEADGQGTWFEIVPPTNCGWQAYVQDETTTYRFITSAWVAAAATTSFAGAVQLADQAAMEALTAGRAVTADVQHFHPGMAKFFAVATVSGAVPTLVASYNVTSITDTATGRLGITIANDFSSANWCCLSTQESDATTALRTTCVAQGTKLAGSVEIIGRNGDGSALNDPASWMVAGFGDQ